MVFLANASRWLQPLRLDWGGDGRDQITATAAPSWNYNATLHFVCPISWWIKSADCKVLAFPDKVAVALAEGLELFEHI